MNEVGAASTLAHCFGRLQTFCSPVSTNCAGQECLKLASTQQNAVQGIAWTGFRISGVGDAFDREHLAQIQLECSSTGT
jgi:hypothetical protein